jgi:hypothetical protein
LDSARFRRELLVPGVLTGQHALGRDELLATAQSRARARFARVFEVFSIVDSAPWLSEHWAHDQTVPSSTSTSTSTRTIKALVGSSSLPTDA